MEAADIAVRFAQYGTLLPLFGLAVFAVYSRPASVDLGWRARVRVLIGFAIAASLLSIMTLTARMGGGLASAVDPSLLQTVIGDTSAGHAWAVRVLALFLALIVGQRTYGLIILSGVSVASLAWSGHAGAAEGTFGLVRLAGDIVHLLAAGVWVGALTAFIGLIFTGTRDRRMIASALAGFSGIGSGVAGALIASGLINTWRSVQWSPMPVLTTSAWGLVLLAKLCLFTGMLGLAAMNRFVLTPNLAAGDASLTRLRLSLGLEIALAVSVLALVSALGLLAPPTAV